MSESPKPDVQWNTGDPSSEVDGSGGATEFPDDPAVAVVLHEVPEFETAYLDLVSDFDDAPGGPAVFTALADFVACRLAWLEAGQTVLERTLGAIEMVANSQDSESTELVGYAFLDSLSPIDRDRIRPWLGSSTRLLLDELDAGSGS
jgi:hypothetical protein